jgi:adenine/guanine/hypoxanthine permease
VVQNPATYLALGVADRVRFDHALVARGMRGGMIFGIVPLPEGIVGFRFDTSTIRVLALPQALQLSLIPVIFALFMTAFLDTMGTVMAVGQQGKLLDENGRPPQLKRILPIDSLGAVGGGATGASSVTSYIESGAGAAVLFVLTFVWPALQKLFS